jgi:hypothetical protein
VGEVRRMRSLPREHHGVRPEHQISRIIRSSRNELVSICNTEVTFDIVQDPDDHSWTRIERVNQVKTSKEYSIAL